MSIASVKLYSLLYKSFSRLNDLSPALYIGTTLAFLSSRGKTPSLKEELISAVRGFTKFVEHCLAIEIGNSSHPALELLSDFII